MKTFRNIIELANLVNAGLGREFCNEFLYKRKTYLKADRIGSSGKLFSAEKSDRNWAINAGGGTEVQYHIAFDREKRIVYYGLGFNAQYVPHANSLTPPQYIQPFANVFLASFDNITLELPDYSFLIGNKTVLGKMQLNDYVLFGKAVPVSADENTLQLGDDEFNVIITDLKRQFNAYKLIFEQRMKKDGIPTSENSQTESKRLNKDSRNIILYGPPGTGKTHILKNEYFARFTSRNASVTKDEYFVNRIQDFSWWEVIGAAILEMRKASVAQIADHPLVRYKTSVSQSKAVKPILWQQLQAHTIEDCPFVNVKKRYSPLIFEKNETSEWSIAGELGDENLIKDLMDEYQQFAPGEEKVGL